MYVKNSQDTSQMWKDLKGPWGSQPSSSCTSCPNSEKNEYFSKGSWDGSDIWLNYIISPTDGAAGAAGAAAQSSRQAAAGKQQASSNQRLPPWKNDQT